MALFQCSFYSNTLGLSTMMNVIFPQQTTNQIGLTGKASGGRYPVLYLLHGLSDDHSIWLRRTNIERYVSELGLVVVMPEVHRSFYSNMVSGNRYWDFVSEELPSIVQSFFPVSDRREDTFAAGLSMGGYGAMKLGLSLPDRFGAVASLSGVTDPSWFHREFPQEFDLIYGSLEQFKNSPNDLFYLAEQFAMASKKTELYMCCGTEDFLYEDNQRFLKHLQRLEVPYIYEEEPGAHEWGYWDMKIQRVLEWLPLGK
ncbi:alpha/beta hydrolase [Marinicrinis lubricantis]|uniref:Alpha/beta hydrolase n=1 Tax=Marinicrinis lubricantis TaxID=2086470 RepID=A0ABW1IKS4_9BACL